MSHSKNSKPVKTAIVAVLIRLSTALSLESVVVVFIWLQDLKCFKIGLRKAPDVNTA
jgi:hypothetical protein